MIVFAPTGREAHDHGVHRRRMRLLPQASQRDRSAQQARRARALPGVSARRPGHRGLAQDGSGVVLEGSQDGDHAGEARPGGEGAELRRDAGRQAVRAGREIWACAARRRSSRATATTSAAICRPRELVEAARRAQDAPRQASKRDSSRDESAQPVTASRLRGSALQQLQPCPACLPTPWHRAARPSSR